MSKRTNGLGISYAIDDASDDDGPNFLAQHTSASKPAGAHIMAKAGSGAENTAPTKRRGRPQDGAKKIAGASKSPSKCTGTDAVLAAKPAGVAKKAAPAKKRQVLKEINNAQDADEIDDLDILSEPNAPALHQPASPPKRRGRKPKAASAEPLPMQKPKAKRGRPAAVAEKEEDKMEIPETQEESAVQSKLARTAAASTKRQPKPAKREQIPETQPEPMDMEEPIAQPMESDRIEDSSMKPPNTMQKRATSTTRQRQLPLHPAGSSASDTERGGQDPSLRRKVGDLTKKLEAMEVKYNSIRDLSVNDAESAFDKLKGQADEKAKAANELITSLRAELKAQSLLASEASSLRSELSTQTSAATTSASEKKTLQNALTEANNEVKALQIKLAATRSSSTAIHSIDNVRVPGSVAKPTAQRTLLVGSAEAAKEAQKRVLKEELYSDLTGLIVRDVKRKEEKGEEVYDCIQTGRNGTLHFHLTLSAPTPSNSNSANSTTSKQAYEDAEFLYTPLLDSNHDRELIEILPDYLTEEICFPRSNAAKFYSRVVDCLTKRVELVEEGEGDE